MKKLLLALGISAFSIAAPMAAYAQAVDFSVADADGNGEVTMEELMEALPDVSADAAASKPSHNGPVHHPGIRI